MIQDGGYKTANAWAHVINLVITAVAVMVITAWDPSHIHKLRAYVPKRKRSRATWLTAMEAIVDKTVKGAVRYFSGDTTAACVARAAVNKVKIIFKCRKKRVQRSPIYYRAIRPTEASDQVFTTAPTRLCSPRT